MVRGIHVAHGFECENCHKRFPSKKYLIKHPCDQIPDAAELQRRQLVSHLKLLLLAAIYPSPSHQEDHPPAPCGEAAELRDDAAPAAPSGKQRRTKARRARRKMAAAAAAAATAAEGSSQSTFDVQDKIGGKDGDDNDPTAAQSGKGRVSDDGDGKVLDNEEIKTGDKDGDDNSRFETPAEDPAAAQSGEQGVEQEIKLLWSILEAYGVQVETLGMGKRDWEVVICDLREALELESCIDGEYEQEETEFEKFCREVIEQYGDALDYAKMWQDIRHLLDKNNGVWI